MLMFALQKKISKWNYNQISIRLSFQWKEALSCVFVRKHRCTGRHFTGGEE